jgi:hypothetical protein
MGGQGTETIRPTYEMSRQQRKVLGQMEDYAPLSISKELPESITNQITGALSKVLGKTVSGVGGKFNVGGTYGSTTSQKAMSDAAVDIASQLPGLLSEQLTGIQAQETSAYRAGLNPLQMQAAMVGSGGFMQPDTIKGSANDIPAMMTSLQSFLTKAAAK